MTSVASELSPWITSAMIEVRPHGSVDLLVLRPQRLVHEGLRGLHHHGGPTLPAVTVRFEIIASKEGQEELARPEVREREAELERRVEPLDALQTLLDPSTRLACRHSLPLGRRAGKQRFDLGQLLPQLRLVHTSPSTDASTAVLPGARPHAKAVLGRGCGIGRARITTASTAPGDRRRPEAPQHLAFERGSGVRRHLRGHRSRDRRYVWAMLVAVATSAVT